MSQFPSRNEFDFSNGGGVLSTAGSIGGLSNDAPNASAAWPTANLGIYVPVVVPRRVTVYKLAIGTGVTATGNFDVGIFDASGHKIVSSGATAKVASTEQVIDIADTVIGPGLYWLGLSVSNTTAYAGLTPSGSGVVPYAKARFYGTTEEASAHPLPATLTPQARAYSPFVPWIAAYLRGY